MCVMRCVSSGVCHAVCVMRCVSCSVSPTLGHIMQLCEKNKTWQSCKYKNSDSRLHRHPRSGAHTELFICCIPNCLGDTCYNCSFCFNKRRCLRMVRGPCIFKSNAFLRQIIFTVTCSLGHSSAVWSKGILRECKQMHTLCYLLEK